MFGRLSTRRLFVAQCYRRNGFDTRRLEYTYVPVHPSQYLLVRKYRGYKHPRQQYYTDVLSKTKYYLAGNMYENDSEIVVDDLIPVTCGRYIPYHKAQKMINDLRYIKE